MIQLPPSLKPGDTLAIVSPSGQIAPAVIKAAEKEISSWNLNVMLGKHCTATYGRFAGTDQERLEDLQAAFDNDKVKAIFCSRGGYGLTRIIDQLNFDHIKAHPKWIIGFSDITALHAALAKNKVASIHGGMARQIMDYPLGDPSLSLRKILFGEFPRYEGATNTSARLGKAKGPLVGGNLCLLNALNGTEFQLNCKGKILLLEEIGEELYASDRMLQNLRQQGVFEQISGLVLGKFTAIKEDPSFPFTFEEMILDATKGTNFPIIFDFPLGHIKNNLPVVLGAETTIVVTETNYTFTQ